MSQNASFERIKRRRDIRSPGGEFGCGKQGFVSYRAAKRMLRSGWARTMGRVAPYHCGDCGLWHVGNPNGFRRAA